MRLRWAERARSLRSPDLVFDWAEMPALRPFCEYYTGKTRTRRTSARLSARLSFYAHVCNFLWILYHIPDQLSTATQCFSYRNFSGGTTRDANYVKA